MPIFASVLVVSLISLIGVFTLALNAGRLQKILFYLVSFSAGALLGDVFLHLVPALAESSGLTLNISIFILTGIILFFILEKFICWRHCHIPTSKKHTHSLAAVNLVGDGLHNFIDGLIIAASYAISLPLGLVTTVAIIAHEIPQEIGDFGVLLYAGVARGKAVFYNFLSALLAFAGAGAGVIFADKFADFSDIITALTIGGFIYIATADLIPELKKENELAQSIKQLLGISLGIALMAVLLFLE
jgi:zinc and cadmium transporter